MNLWWLKFNPPLSSGIVKARELTSLEASATNDADAIIIMTNVMNLWWLKFDFPLSSGIVKALALTSLEASATNDADAIIIMSKAKLAKKL
ncbi:hypothetical protein TNCT_220501 [Trichonephila clavata]|uniref:Uncharacterized protein n=1 Tax=Trichonephila clavata TaxID=2740835 RepID=A0A8X6JKM0_TRICU|nr:hypothetical protein TNCT_220501 [Trichonephila clavata]